MVKRKNKYRWDDYTRQFYSHINRRLIWLEGAFEREVALSFEFSKNIVRYQSQPVRLSYRDAEQAERVYTPDFVVTFSDAPTWSSFTFIEAKKAEFACKPDFRELMRCVRVSLTHKPWAASAALRVVTENESGNSIVQSNYQRLYHYKRVPVERHICPHTLRKTFGGPISLSELRVWAEREGLPPPVPFAIIAHGYFDIDFTQLLSEETELEFTKR